MQKALNRTLERTNDAKDLAVKTLLSAQEIQRSLEETYRQWIDTATTNLQLAEGHLAQLQNDSLEAVARRSENFDQSQEDIRQYLEELIKKKDDTFLFVKNMLAQVNNDAENIIEKSKEQGELIIMQAEGDDDDNKRSAQALAESTNTSARYLAEKMKLLATNRATVIKEEIEALVTETHTMLNNFGEQTAQDGWDQVAQAKLKNAESAVADQKNRLNSLEDEREIVVTNAKQKVEKWKEEVERISLLVVAATEAVDANGIDLSSFKRKAKLAGINSNEQELEKQFMAMDKNNNGIISGSEVGLFDSNRSISFEDQPKSFKKIK